MLARPGNTHTRHWFADPISGASCDTRQQERKGKEPRGMLAVSGEQIPDISNGEGGHSPSPLLICAYGAPSVILLSNLDENLPGKMLPV